MEQLGSQWTDFHEIWYLNIFRNCVKKSQVPLKSDKNNGTSLGGVTIVTTVSRWILLIMRNILDKICRENQNRHLWSITFFRKLAIYETMWKNMVEPERPQTTIRRMRFACWITEATHTLTICNTVFPRQQWFNERTSTLRYAYFAWLVIWSVCSIIGR
jgi:hypothetical protein